MDITKIIGLLPKCSQWRCTKIATMIGGFVDNEAEDEHGETCSKAVICYGCDEHPRSCNVVKEELPYASVVREYNKSKESQ